MLTDRDLALQLPFVLESTNFTNLGLRYAGKVRDNYTQGDRRYLVTTDRLSCFDRIVTSIPFKGQVLTQMAAYWFQQTKNTVSNHVLDMPDPNVMVVKNCQVLPVEVVVRAYLAGSAWKDYQAGKPVSGVVLPPNLRNSEKLPQIIVTPSTKAEIGSHDMPISEAEIVARNIVTPKLWQEVREAALDLFVIGTTLAAQQGLILVDTKYEFGLYQGQLTLVDEIHTLDCSRYWRASSYRRRFETGESPEMLDKQPVREWLLSQGYQGEGPVPEFDNERRVSIARHYIQSFEQICGFPLEAKVESVEQRIRSVLAC